MKLLNVDIDCSELESDECDILVASPFDLLPIIPSCISCGHVDALIFRFSIDWLFLRLEIYSQENSLSRFINGLVFIVQSWIHAFDPSSRSCSLALCSFFAFFLLLIHGVLI